MQSHVYLLHALSALHCGTGQAAGIVDLPIARARATQLPIVPGSSTRGVLREHLTTQGNNQDVRTLFGPNTISSDADAYAGALAVGDAHLLVLPVRALSGILCYATCPFILRRLLDDLRRSGLQVDKLELPPSPQAEHAWVIPGGSKNVLDGKLGLEDLDLTAQSQPRALDWAEAIALRVHPGDATAQDDFKQRFAILPDDTFGFLAETATEVRTRIAIDPQRGTVARGQLWNEENLPAETVLWGIYALSDSMNRADDDQRNANILSAALPDGDTLLQLGGKAGVGRGLVRFLTPRA